MSADLEQLKEFLLRPLFDQGEGTKGFIAPPLVDSQHLSSYSREQIKEIDRQSSSLKSGATKLERGVKEQKCEFVIDLVVLMRKHPDFNGVQNIGEGSFAYAIDLFERSGFSFDKIMIKDISQFSTSGENRIESLERILNEPEFISYEGEVLEPVIENGSSSALTKTLSTEWAKVALMKAAPILVEGLTPEFMKKVVETVVNNGVFNKDVDDLCRLIEEKFENIIMSLFAPNASFELRTDDQFEDPIKYRMERITDVLGRQMISNFNFNLKIKLLETLAKDPAIVEAFEGDKRQQQIQKILLQEIGVKLKSGPT